MSPDGVGKMGKISESDGREREVPRPANQSHEKGAQSAACEQKNENEEAVAFHSLELQGDLPRKQRFENVPAVERGNGQQVYPGQGEVGGNARLEHFQQKLARGGAHEKFGGGEKQQTQAHGEHHGENHVGERPGCGNEQHALAVVAEVARIDGHGFGPAEHEGREHGREHEHGRAHGIDVGHGIQGKAAEHAGGGIAAAQGGPAVGHFVQNDAQKNGHEGHRQMRYLCCYACVEHGGFDTIFIQLSQERGNKDNT